MARLYKESSVVMRIIISLAFVVSTVSVVEAQTNAWLRVVLGSIKVMESTQLEVEQVFADTSKEKIAGKVIGNTVYYSLKSANLMAIYSTDCTVDRMDKDPSNNILTEILLDLGGEIPASKLGLDLKGFDLFQDEHSPRVQWYDDVRGITIYGGKTRKGENLISQVKVSRPSNQKKVANCGTPKS